MPEGQQNRTHVPIGEAMARVKYPWETYVKSMIIRFPQFKKELAAMRLPALVPPTDKVGSCQKVSKPTEETALRELPPTKQRQYDAVQKAIEKTMTLPDGECRLKLIELMYWKQTHRLHGAAAEVGCCTRTAVTWHTMFIRMVGYYFGILEEE